MSEAPVTAEVAIAERDEAINVVDELMTLFRREMSQGHSTHEQQAALRWARALLASHGRGER